MSSYDGSGARDTYFSSSDKWRGSRPYLANGWEYKRNRVLAYKYACMCESLPAAWKHARESKARIPSYINTLPRDRVNPEMSDLILETDRAGRMNI